MSRNPFPASRCLLALALALATTSCALTTKQSPVSPPAECLQPVVTQDCTLRPELVNLDLPDQLAMILACEVTNGKIKREWQAKHRCLVRAINEQ